MSAIRAWDPEMSRAWGRYLDLDTPVEDLLIELEEIVSAMPNAQCAELVGMFGRLSPLAHELRKRHEHVSAALQAFCDLAIGRQT